MRQPPKLMLGPSKCEKFFASGRADACCKSPNQILEGSCGPCANWVLAPLEGLRPWPYFTSCFMKLRQGVNCPRRLPGSRSMRKNASVAWSGRQLGKPRWRRSLHTSRRSAGSMKGLLLLCNLKSYFCLKTKARNKAMSMTLSSVRSRWDK